MSRVLKQGTVRSLLVFMVSSTDHRSGVQGATLTVQTSKAGAAFATITPVIVEVGFGWYSLSLSLVMTNTFGDLAFHVTATGCDPYDEAFQVVGYDPNAAYVDSVAYATLFSTAVITNAVAKTTDVTSAVSTLATAAALSTVASIAAAINSKTANLTFTKANEVDVNLQSVNDVTIIGDGAATKFGV